MTTIPTQHPNDNKTIQWLALGIGLVAAAATTWAMLKTVKLYSYQIEDIEKQRMSTPNDQIATK